MKRIAFLLALVALAMPLTANAWWNSDWKFRKKIQVNTSPTGADLKDSVAPGLVAVRLHSGNFLFTDARPDGGDLRFVANDDKTPLRYFVEYFDGANQLALVWVQLPHVTPGTSADFFYMYSGSEKAPAAGDAKTAYDAQRLLALEFAETQPPFKDGSAFASPVTGDALPDPTGLFGGAAQFSGKPLLVQPASTVHVAAGGGFTFSAWVRPGAPQTAQLFSWSGVTASIEDGRFVGRIGRTSASGGQVPVAGWTHVALTVADRMILYVNGVQVAEAAVQVPDLAGPMSIGDGFQGSLDSLAVDSAARSASWMQLVASQGSEGKLLSYGESEASEDAGGVSYIKILFASLTLDAKVVIAILGVMFLIAVSVMVSKALQLSRVSRSNTIFIAAFEAKPLEMLQPASQAAQALGNGAIPDSSLARLYETGMRELGPRLARRSGALPAESVAAIKASIDATFIRENQRLNNLMVLLTIAISGGPFLGLLGTVVGVMITFASIAAAGDVNINAIAPGIAAALLATVAGLAVAIPSLFGYNYLITRIKSIAADMQAFSDEFICRMAEAHNQ